MTIAYELAGHRFGKLIVIERIENNSHGRSRWKCRCDCGKEKITTSSQLVRSRCLSCGCLRGRCRITHGHAGKYIRSKTYMKWAGMKRRCDNVHEDNYNRYGGRGINYHPHWSDFGNFLADMGECPPGYTLERIDVNGNYEPKNCKWIPAKEQAINTRRNRMVTYCGETLPLVLWIRRLRLPYSNILRRLQLGWSVEDAFTKPINKKVAAT